MVTVFSFVPRGKLQHFTMVFAVAFVVNTLYHTLLKLSVRKDRFLKKFPIHGEQIL